MNLEELVDNLGNALKSDLEALEVTPKVKAYKWASGGSGLDSVPAAVVQLPKIKRTPVDRPEDHLGQLDVGLEFEVFFFFDASSVAVTMPQALEIVCAFIDQIDGDLTLGDRAAEAKVTNAEPTNVDSEGSSRALFGYACTVEVEAYL